MKRLLLLLLCGCGSEAPAEPLSRLSDWALFDDIATQAPADRVVPYDVNAALFSDHAAKHRFLFVPEGEHIGYDAEEPWDFPLGTILVKTFAFPVDARDPSLGERLIETRLLVREESGFRPYVYVYGDESDEATRIVAGEIVPVTTIAADGETYEPEYRVPNTNQCSGCHAGSGALAPLGPRARQLGGESDALGSLPLEPVPTDEPRVMVDPFGDAPLEQRARSYLDANCAHCHRPGGTAASTGLYLGWDIEDESALGACRGPIAAGRGTGGHRFDVVPGDPDASVMIFRVESEEPGIKMPELPTVLHDPRGAALLREWIAAMEPRDCLE